MHEEDGDRTGSASDPNHRQQVAVLSLHRVSLAGVVAIATTQLRLQSNL